MAIVSVNPVGGKEDFCPTEGRARLHEAASAIALSSDAGPFEEMNEAYRLGMPVWGPQWRHMDAILTAARRDLTELAYPYLVPFRTRGGAGSVHGRDVVDRAFRVARRRRDEGGKARARPSKRSAFGGRRPKARVRDLDIVKDVGPDHCLLRKRARVDRTGETGRELAADQRPLEAPAAAPAERLGSSIIAAHLRSLSSIL
jgi:hypothetical protein